MHLRKRSSFDDENMHKVLWDKGGRPFTPTGKFELSCEGTVGTIWVVKGSTEIPQKELMNVNKGPDCWNTLKPCVHLPVEKLQTLQLLEYKIGAEELSLEKTHHTHEELGVCVKVLPYIPVTISVQI